MHIHYGDKLPTQVGCVIGLLQATCATNATYIIMCMCAAYVVYAMSNIKITQQRYAMSINTYAGTR